VAKKEQSTNQFLEALKILANKLDKKQYNKVTSIMFRLYMGDKIGYRSTFDPQVMADINAVWQFGREKKVEKKAKLYKLKIIRGGKNE
jgi:hypothetical protein|tara:strand:- start:67 stop:330 length:264 start_codon:yes stop_codon:yes gene_type:complete